VRRKLYWQIKDIIVIEKDQKKPKKNMTESVFDSRQRWSMKLSLQVTGNHCTSCDLDHLIQSNKLYLYFRSAFSPLSHVNDLIFLAYACNVIFAGSSQVCILRCCRGLYGLGSWLSVTVWSTDNIP